MFAVTKDNFDQIANTLLNKCLLIINGSEWRIVEIEFYYYSNDHQDDYTHKDENQKKNGEWYFHRQNGKSYKGGSYKGLDISCGNGKDYGGILIRSIECAASCEAKCATSCEASCENTLIEGPCNVVNKILELTNCADISSLVHQISLNVMESDLLYIVPNDKIKEKNIQKGPRVGLTFKKIQSFEYIYKNYRYTTSTQIKKNKCTMVLSEYIHKRDIAHTTNTKKWISFYNEGKKKNKEYFLDNPALNTVQIQCELLGYITTL